MIFERSQFTNLNNYVEFNSFITGSSSVALENTTNFQTTKNTQSKRISNLMYAVIGLAAVSLITSMMYLYTRLLEKRLKNIHIV